MALRQNFTWDSEMIRKIWLYLLTLALFTAPAWAQNNGEIRADRYGAIVVEARSGKILMAEHADRLLHPASLTKLMTLYLTFAAMRAGKINGSSELSVSPYSANASPTKLGLQAGDTVSAHDAVLGVITRSANDAARVLAENIGGNETKFAQMMTSTARRLGMRNTVFRNASGLPNPGQISTPKDMAILARAIITHFPEYYPLFSTQDFDFRGQDITTHNHLMARYPGMDGMKTGYVAASGFNLVASAVQNNIRLIGVVYGGRTALLRDEYMADMLDKSFAQAELEAAHSSPRYAGTVMQPTRANLTPQPPSDIPSTQNTPSEVAAAQAPTKNDPTPPPATETKREDTVAVDKIQISNRWGVQIGSFKSRGAAQRALVHAKTNYHNLHGSAPVIAAVKTRSGRLYQARLTGLTQPNAVNACGALQARGHSCVPLKPVS